MSFSKASQLIELAMMIAAYRTGVPLGDVEERFGVSHRTAQRMMRAVETCFPDVETITDEEGRRRWRMSGRHLRELMSLTADELAALDLAIEHLRRGGNDIEANGLGGLKEKVLSLVPRAQALRLETDHEALLEAQGLVARPGPRPHADAAVTAVIGEAIKACRIIEMRYRSLKDPEPRPRLVAPYGMLSGLRRYLVGRPADDLEGPVRTYRMDAIVEASLSTASFTRPADFDLQAFANRAFGVFQNEEEYGEVVWRFSPEAAVHARSYQFHPDQAYEEQPDGSLIVRFKAAGLLEMCWHLYGWGDKVEVLSPSRLREMVAEHRRKDFPALP